MLLFSRQGKLRLQKWYVPLSDKERKKISRDLVQTILARKPKMCSFLEWRDLKIVYKRCVNKIGLSSDLLYMSLVPLVFNNVCGYAQTDNVTFQLSTVPFVDVVSWYPLSFHVTSYWLDEILWGPYHLLQDSFYFYA